MNPEASTGSSQPSASSSSSSSSFQAQFPNQSQNNNLPFFSATVKFPMSFPVPFQCVIGVQPLSPCFYQFCPSPSPGGYFSQEPTGPTNPLGPNSLIVDLDESSHGGRDQNGCSVLNGLVEKCAFSNQQLDPSTKKCPVTNCVCQGPKGNQINNGGAKATKSSSCQKIQNGATQGSSDVRAIEGAKNLSTQVSRCSAFKPVEKEPPRKSAAELVQDHQKSNKTMQLSDDAHRMEKEPEKRRASIPKLMDIAEKDALNEAAKKAILIRPPRARGIFTVISGKSSEKAVYEVVQVSDKLADLKDADDNEADEPVKKKKKPGPKPKKRC